MNARLVFACAATGIALTTFAAAPAGAAPAGPIEGEIAVVAATEPPTTPPAEPSTGTPTTPPADSPAPPTTGPVDTPPQQVPVPPKGGADTGSLDVATEQGPDAGVVALGGMVLLGAGGLGIAALRRRQRT